MSTHEDRMLAWYCAQYQDALDHDQWPDMHACVYATSMAKAERRGLVAAGSTVQLLVFLGQLLAADGAERRNRTSVRVALLTEKPAGGAHAYPRS